MFLAEFGKKHLDNHLISRRIVLHLELAVRFGIDRGVHPEQFVVELDHGFVGSNVIRVGTICGAVNQPSVSSCGRWIDNVRYPTSKESR